MSWLKLKLLDFWANDRAWQVILIIAVVGMIVSPLNFDSIPSFFVISLLGENLVFSALVGLVYFRRFHRKPKGAKSSVLSKIFWGLFFVFMLSIITIVVFF